MYNFLISLTFLTVIGALNVSQPVNNSAAVQNIKKQLIILNYGIYLEAISHALSKPRISSNDCITQFLSSWNFSHVVFIKNSELQI